MYSLPIISMGELFFHFTDFEAHVIFGEKNQLPICLYHEQSEYLSFSLLRLVNPLASLFWLHVHIGYHGCIDC